MPNLLPFKFNFAENPKLALQVVLETAARVLPTQMSRVVSF